MVGARRRRHVRTFIEFPASLGVGEVPPLFLVDAKGTASLVNYRL
jgi:type IV secretion system protein VirB9